MSCGYPSCMDRCTFCHITGVPLCHRESDEDININITCVPQNTPDAQQVWVEQLAYIPSDLARTETIYLQNLGNSETIPPPKDQSKFRQEPSPTTIVRSAHVFSPIHRPYQSKSNTAMPNLAPPSTPQQKPLLASVSPLRLFPLGSRSQPHASDDIQVEVLRKRASTVLPSTNSLPAKPLQFQDHIPQLGLPVSRYYLAFQEAPTAQPVVHHAAPDQDTITQTVPTVSCPPTTTASIQAHPCQQIVQAQEAEYCRDESSNGGTTTSAATTNLESFDLIFKLKEELIEKMERTRTAKQWYELVMRAVDCEGARYVKNARTMRRKERENHALELEGRIGKLKCAKTEGNKFGSEKEIEVRKVVVRKLLVPYFKLPFKQDEVVVTVPFPKIIEYFEVPYQDMRNKPLRFAASDLSEKDSILVFPRIVANTTEELENWMEGIQEVRIPLFVKERSRTVLELLNSQRPEVSKAAAKKLKDKIDAKIKAVRREDLRSTQVFTLEQFVNFGFNSKSHSF